METYDYDLIIIGAGPGGYEAAYDAAKYGMKTAVVEMDELGGTCLNRGCIPTKAIMHSSDVARDARDGEPLGVEVRHVKVDIGKVKEHKDEVITTLRDGIASGFKRSKIETISGVGTVTAPHEVSVRLSENGQTDTLTSHFIMIATGSVPAVPPIEGIDLEGVIDSTELLDNGEKLYDDLVIIGGGVIGVEFATVYNDFGSNVTILEAMDRLLPNMDKELGRGLKSAMQKDGVDIHTKAFVERIEKKGGRLSVVYKEKDKEESVPADAVLVAVGRKANTSAVLGEKYRGLADRHGIISVDENYRTEIEDVYAIGDAIGGIQLAHTATAEGRNAVAHMNGDEMTIDMDTVPSCIYSKPEIASVGLTQDEAKAEDLPVITKKYAMGANGKTVIEGLGRGFIKIVALEENHTIVGAQLMCGRATDLIGELAVVIKNGLTLEEVADTIHPHPTFVEAIAEAAR
jgi:dihydrolipoamide dehydrogenase